MKKTTIKIIALVPSEFQQGYYTLLLEEPGTNRQLPIIIGAFAAQSIAQTLNKELEKRPNNYDLMLSLLHQVNATITELVIEDVKDGIFQNILIGKKTDGSSLKMKARVGEGIAIALRLNLPITVTEKVMEEVGVIIEESGKVVPIKNRNLSDYSIQELEEMLHEMLEEEDYKNACKVRDLIQEKKKLKRA